MPAPAASTAAQGWGLAISRELATLLGGEIRLSSEPRQGQHVHALSAAGVHAVRRSAEIRPTGTALPAAGQTPALTILPVVARGKNRRRSRHRAGWRSGCAHRRRRSALCPRVAGPGARQGIQRHRGHARQTGAGSCRRILPAAITLDIFLPDMLGWTVLNNLKLNPKTRHIPVQIISLEEEQQHGLSHGAFSYMVKPVTTEGIGILLRPDPDVSSRRISSGC